MNRYIRWFSEVGLVDIPLVGGKNALLGELFRELTAKGINVLVGFAGKADAYRAFISEPKLDRVIRAELESLDARNIAELRRRDAKIRHAMLAAEPPGLAVQITDAYTQLGDPKAGNTSIAVRSSATAEDLPDASFAGQQETCLNVQGPKEQALEAKDDNHEREPVLHSVRD
jgi:pyruvate, water dikinase